MTRQQELELLAEWLGIEHDGPAGDWLAGKDSPALLIKGTERVWNPSPEGNDTDFLNMVAGRVDIDWLPFSVVASIWNQTLEFIEAYDAHNNGKLAAMKHAAYQVCLMAAREGKESK